MREWGPGILCAVLLIIVFFARDTLAENETGENKAYELDYIVVKPGSWTRLPGTVLSRRRSFG